MTEIDSFMVGVLVTITRLVDLLWLTLSMPCFSPSLNHLGN
jgi:hypothetical protein